MTIYKPNRFIVGFSNFEDTVKAHLTPDDKSHTIKSRLSTLKYNSDSNFGIKNIENNFLSGFSFHSLVYKGAPAPLVQDPRGFLFKQSPEYFQRLINYSIIQQNLFINRLIYVKINKSIVLISELDEEIISKMLTEEQFKISQTQKHIPGCKIETKEGSEYIFIGRFHPLEISTKKLHPGLVASFLLGPSYNYCESIRLQYYSSRMSFYKNIATGQIETFSRRLQHTNIVYDYEYIKEYDALNFINNNPGLITNKKHNSKILGASDSQELILDKKPIPRSEISKYLQDPNKSVGVTLKGNKFIIKTPITAGNKNPQKEVFEVNSFSHACEFVGCDVDINSIINDKKSKFFELFLKKPYKTDIRINI